MKDDGGAAFPYSRHPEGLIREDSEGMTLRDYFAGQAIQGVMAAVAVASAALGFDCTQHDEPLMARQAYTIADAMLKERNK